MCVCVCELKDEQEKEKIYYFVSPWRGIVTRINNTNN